MSVSAGVSEPQNSSREVKMTSRGLLTPSRTSPGTAITNSGFLSDKEEAGRKRKLKVSFVKTFSKRWMSEEQKEVNYLPWYPGQPNGGRHQHCTEAKIDPSQDLGAAHKNTSVMHYKEFCY